MRQVPYKLLERDVDTDQVLGFLPGAFAHRLGEEYLSLGWLEYFGGTHAYNAAQCKAAIQTVRKDNKALHGVAQVERPRYWRNTVPNPCGWCTTPTTETNPTAPCSWISRCPTLPAKTWPASFSSRNTESFHTSRL
jgi:hypothetical protein